MQGEASTTNDGLSQRRVVVVEDETLVGLFLAEVLSALEVEICGVAPDGRTALDLAAKHQPYVALIDLNLQGEMNGIATARLMSAQHGTRIIFISGNADKAEADEVKALRPVAFLAKPFLEEEVKVALQKAFLHG